MITMRPRRAALPGRAGEGDAGLVRRVGRGDDGAFEALFARYRDPLHRYCRAVLRHEQDAEDAFQATMIRAYRALRRGGEQVALKPWLFRIAHNECVRVVGARRDDTGLSGEERATGGSPAEALESREAMAQLREDLLALPEQQRAALVLREMSGLSHAQIGEALGTTPDVAKHLIHEGRLSLGEFAAGRSLACGDVRMRISDGDGRVLRARSVRSHLRGCSGCREFREGIARRPRQLAALFPALPAVAAQRSAAEILAALGTGSGAAGSGVGAKAVVAWVSAAALVVSGGAMLPHVPEGAPSAPAAVTAGPSGAAAPPPQATTAAALSTSAAPVAAAPARRGAVQGPRATPVAASGRATDPAPAPAPAPPGGEAVPPGAGGPAPAPRAAPEPAADPPPRSSAQAAQPPAAVAVTGSGAQAVGVTARVAAPVPVAPVTVDAGVSADADEGVAVGAAATVETPVVPVEANVDATVGGDSTASVRVEAAPALGLPPVEITVPRLLPRR